MAKSFKFKNDYYLDSSSIMYHRENLQDKLYKMDSGIQNRVRGFTIDNGWAKTFSFPIYSPQHALVIVNNCLVAFIWKGGASTTGGYHYVKIYDKSSDYFTANVVTGDNKITFNFSEAVTAHAFVF